VRYEALIPARTLREICAFMGVSYSDQMLDYPADTNDRPVDRQRGWVRRVQKQLDGIEMQGLR
jgi:hypothetical protein